LLPCALWLSRKLGIPVYCCGICPLGMTANLLARLSPWRLRRNGHCTGCRACARVCRYGALRLDGDGRVAGPGWRCTLCRDCMSVCRHRALEIRCCGQGGAWVEQALLCSLSVLHTLFLFTGRV
ncbi:4Fe-4S dicluster domain-containing protein, partial [Desulfovibrio sp.]|uniref:4Fe-4S dicluster domain-containing protein n=1 Tax=Desulfovibrio sp. TaxID=885 RepID=UPI003AB1645D